MTDDTRWLARLIPPPGQSVDDLIALPLGLDIWERRDDRLVVAATAGQLAEIERRRLAAVERLETVQQFLGRQPSDPGQ